MKFKIQNLKFKKQILYIAGIILIVFVFLFVFINMISPVSCEGEEKLIVIEKGWGSGEIAQKLKNENLIKSKWFFVFYVWFRGYNEHLQAGEYMFKLDMTIFKIANMIANGEVAPNWVKITIPEGWTNKQIEERLIKYGVISLNDELPKNKEGYLFPDTYYFNKEAGIESVIEKMQDNFNKKIEDLEIKDLEKIIILASIVQNEVLSVEDMKIVAGIFYNRLEIGMALQSDATVNYVTGKGERQPSIQDIKVDSLYNTYLYRGLPPGPISNPGLDAIKAVIYPEDTDYLYFLNPLDGTTIFSRTLEEHNRNKAKYLDN